jgi:hypothetical protein
MSRVSPPRLLVLACSATKRPDPGYMPAIDRYDGPLWQTLRMADPLRTKAKSAFLSAHYGFRDTRDSMKPYDARMTPEIAARMKAGGLSLRWPPQKSQRLVMPEGDHAGMHINTMSENRRRPFVDVALVGGQLYLDVMRHFVGLFREAGHITPDARIVEINGPIGQMRRDLRLWLNGQHAEER